MIFIDFETRSECDLAGCGQVVYANDPTTEVLCMAWSFDGKSTGLWKRGDDLDPAVVSWIEGGGEVHAHNAAFEIAIWNNVCVPKMGWPSIKLDQWHCTAALAASFGLPRSLKAAGSVLKLDVQKDTEGNKVMLSLCKPQKVVEGGLFGGRAVFWNDSESDFQILYDYCRQDVLAEWAIHHALPSLVQFERDVWLANERCNQLGIPVALEAVEESQRIVNECQALANETLRQVTRNKVNSVNKINKLVEWVQGEGVKIKDLTQLSVERALATELPDQVRQVLEIRQATGLASVTKLPAFVKRTHDGRSHGTLSYYGAQATGRFSGHGIQVHNVPQGSLNDSGVDQAREVIAGRDPLATKVRKLGALGKPVEVVSSCLRSFIEAKEGNHLLIADYSAIEARVLAWLAGEQHVVDLFEEGDKTGQGGLVYEDMASRIYDLPREQCTKATPEGKGYRDIGKMAVLGCGYSMGWMTFRDQCNAKGANLSAKMTKKIVKTYRESNPNIKAFWRQINEAGIRAVNRQETVDLGKIKLHSNDRWLRILLPSGRCLHYHSPEVRKVDAPWTVGFKGPLSIPKERDMEKALVWLEESGIRFDPGAVDHWDRRIPEVFVPRGAIRLLTRYFGKQDLVVNPVEQVDQICFKGVVKHAWADKRLYGGLLTENVTQAIARDILGSALHRADLAGFSNILHVHDEMVAEENVGSKIHTLKRYEEIMSKRPDWALDCPIAVEGFTSRRYKK